MCPQCVVVAVLLEVLDVPDRAVYTFASNSFLSVPSPCASYTFITWVLSHQKWAFSMAPPYCVLRGYKQYTYIKLYKNNRYLQYLLEYVPHSSGYNN